MIRAVIFDFGNVICRFDLRLFVDRLSRLQNKSGHDPQEILRQSFDIGREYETGLISSDEFFQRIIRRYGLSISREDFVDAFTKIFAPIPSTFDLIRRLKPLYRLGLLSNTNEWHYEHAVRRVEVFPLFDAVTVSFEVKAMKPDERIFLDMFTKLHVRPDECVYIDDLDQNAAVACRLGAAGIHYTSHETLVSSLHALGVSV